ncbi:MAG: tetratricopeptide repeat protein [Candidatus Moranbacteria bacterium]|jgi:tetratricopeptide (TPR) repeat protein|nr:tetratricopeptide repeat protein [Candidatus Moranbacteria bacterium]
MEGEKPSFARFAGGSSLAARSAESTTPVSVTRPVSASARTASETGSTGGNTPKTARLFESVITVALVALFSGLPLFFTGLTFQGIAFEKQLYFYLWLLVALVAWVSKGVTTGDMRIRRTPLDIPILLFWAVYVAGAFFSVDRWHSFWGFFGDPSRGVISITALVLAYYLILSHFTVARFRLIFGGFLTASFLLVVWSFLALMNIHFLPAVLEKYAPISLIGTVSTLTTYLGLLVPLYLTALFALWREKTEKKRLRTTLTVFIFIGLALSLFLLLALYAFVPWIVVLGGLSFFMIYILAQIVRPTEQWTWVPMLVFAMVLGFLMIGSNSLVRATLPVEVSPNVTLSWQVAKETLKEHFALGAGPANYGYAFSMFRPIEYNQNSLYTLRFYQGNGLFFESLAAIGVVGTVLLLVVWFSFLSVGLYLLTMEKQRNKIYSLGLWTAVVMFFIAAFIAPVNGPLLLIGALLSSLALGVLLMESGSEEKYLNLSFKAAPKFALALAFIFMVVSAGVAFIFVFMGKVFIADLTAGQAVRLASQAPSRDAAVLLAQAIQRYPQEGRYFTRLGQEYMALANVEAGKGEQDRDVNTVATYVRQAVVAGEQGRRLMPNDVMAAESLALIYENGAVYASDALPKAEELYMRAKELEPHNPLYFLKLGQIKRTEGDAKPEGAEKSGLYNEARDLYQQAIAEKSNLAVAHYNLAIVLARLKETDKAIDSANVAVTIDPKNLNYRYNVAVLYQLRAKDGDEKKAEDIFLDILKTNDKLIDVRLSLGLLYEKQGKKQAAIDAYQKIVDLLPSDSEGNLKQTREQVQKLISNVQNGVGNLKNPVAAVQAAQQAVTTTPAEQPVSPAPAGPNASPLTEPAP